MTESKEITKARADLINRILRLIENEDSHDAYAALSIAQTLLVKRLGWVTIS
jgi:hypothetical protein